MQEPQDNAELVKAYIALIEQKTKFDIAYFSQTSDVQKNWNDNQAKMNASWPENQAKVIPLHVTSRTIIRPSMEQLGVGFEPFLHGL